MVHPGNSLFLYSQKVTKAFALVAFAVLVSLTGCRKEPLTETEEGEELSGGQVTVFDQSPNAFGHPAAGLQGLDELEFFVGNSFFNQVWVSAPASTTARDGLGPFFNARACSSCHFKDGRGRPPSFLGEPNTGLLLRLGHQQTGSTVPDPIYGGQLQDQAIQGIPVEGSYAVILDEINGEFPDGASYTLQKPRYEIQTGSYGNLHPDNLVSPRVANQMIGLGLLEAIPATEIEALADPSDRDQDGISGRTNRVWSVARQQYELGRFGWKANQPDLEQQSAAAFVGDMGITTRLFPEENCTSSQWDCQAAANGGQPEIEDDDLRKVVLYVSTLSVPARRGFEDPTVIQGKNLFLKIGCGSCHSPKWTTGKHPTIDALSNQIIRPFTDMLLHDMGEGLADGSPDFEATGSEWRTPPLWGIGLFETVNGHTRYLHDGRARNLTEAILWHGGEGDVSNQRFQQLSHQEREAVLAFLNSL